MPRLEYWTCFSKNRPHIEYVDRDENFPHIKITIHKRIINQRIRYSYTILYQNIEVKPAYVEGAFWHLDINSIKRHAIKDATLISQIITENLKAAESDYSPPQPVRSY